MQGPHIEIIIPQIILDLYLDLIGGGTQVILWGVGKYLVQYDIVFSSQTFKNRSYDG